MLKEVVNWCPRNEISKAWKISELKVYEMLFWNQKFVFDESWSRTFAESTIQVDIFVFIRLFEIHFITPTLKKASQKTCFATSIIKDP